MIIISTIIIIVKLYKNYKISTKKISTLINFMSKIIIKVLKSWKTDISLIKILFILKFYSHVYKM